MQQPVRCLGFREGKSKSVTPNRFLTRSTTETVQKELCVFCILEVLPAFLQTSAVAAEILG